MIIHTEVNADTSSLNFMSVQKIYVRRWEIIGDYRRREEYLQYLISQLYDYSTKNNFNLYLVLGDDCFNDNTKIIQYYKLWKLLKKQHLEVRNAIYSEEIMITKNNKVKFFGGIQISDRESVSDIVSILLVKLTAHLLLLPEGLKVTTFLQSGFSKIIAENSEYIENVVSSGGIVLFREGYFDDRNTDFIGFGELSLITKDLFGKTK
ncbi:MULTISPECIES: hypothetical protein [Streptococcus]|jgi:hypothetical protein|uniref:Uncharacterized protein n=2 Tax=Streptococcus TaxID=1301 RepID=A0A1X1IR89_STROR|nr:MULTISPECIES: hypothetical protein [Streptococcus]ORO75652.1 hypothetical protein B7709_06815 [Streptococcus oralis subsp. dentisani]RSI78289.1 hypothetical protein D8856_04705 [Streptococcus mitis]